MSIGAWLGRAVAVCVTGLCTHLSAASSQPAPLGTAPTYTTRTLTPSPNAEAVVARIWVPGLDAGYVPQGVTIVDGNVFVGAYLSTLREVERGPCRIYRVDAVSGQTTGQLDLPSTCGHAGGLARGPAGRIYLADTRIVFEITLQTGRVVGGEIGKVTRTTKLSGAVKGSFAAGTQDALWLGSYQKDGPGTLYRVPHTALTKDTVNEADATAAVPIPPNAQGAAFDGAGRLWITRSGSTFGELLQLDISTGAVQARYAMPAGIEDLTFDAAGHIWTLSEAGSRRWNTWKTFQPILFRLDPKRLAR